MGRYNAAHMYKVVSDVSKYQEFLPYCTQSMIQNEVSRLVIIGLIWLYSRNVQVYQLDLKHFLNSLPELLYASMSYLGCNDIPVQYAALNLFTQTSQRIDPLYALPLYKSHLLASVDTVPVAVYPVLVCLNCISGMDLSDEWGRLYGHTWDRGIGT
jgi:hypothetical protein